MNITSLSRGGESSSFLFSIPPVLRLLEISQAMGPESMGSALSPPTGFSLEPYYSHYGHRHMSSLTHTGRSQSEHRWGRGCQTLAALRNLLDSRWGLWTSGQQRAQNRQEEQV